MPRLPACLMLALLVPGSPAQALTADECNRNRDEFLQSIEENRRNGVQRLEAELAQVRDPTRRDLLAREVDELWEFEESMRAVGDQMFRDCMRQLREEKS